MRWAYHIKYKIKTACFLTGMILIILLSNLSERSSFTDLDRSVSTMMDDRLLPTTYLYGISNGLHHKRLVHASGQGLSRQEKGELLKKHDASIERLVTKYEGTVLTKEEKEKWMALKKHLATCDQLEAASAANMTDTQLAYKLNEQFALLARDIDALIDIQVGVGKDLQKASTTVVNHTVLLSYLEFGVLIMLGLFTMVLLSVSDNAIFGQNKHQALN